jgi:hypothetical protein
MGNMKPFLQTAIGKFFFVQGLGSTVSLHIGYGCAHRADNNKMRLHVDFHEYGMGYIVASKWMVMDGYDMVLILATQRVFRVCGVEVAAQAPERTSFTKNIPQLLYQNMISSTMRPQRKFISSVLEQTQLLNCSRSAVDTGQVTTTSVALSTSPNHNDGRFVQPEALEESITFQRC